MPNMLQGQFMSWQMPPGEKEISIPFENYNNYILLNVKANGVPMRFIFDTGSRYHLFTQPALGLFFKVDTSKTFFLTGSDRSTLLETYIIRGVSLDISGLKADNQSVLILKNDAFLLEEYIGTSVSGILGADLLLRYVVEINYQKSMIKFIEREKYNPPGKGYSKLPLEIKEDYAYINTHLELPDHSRLPAKLLLDTGGGMTSLIHLQPSDSLILKNTVSGKLGIGLGGELKGYLMRMPTFDIAEYQLHNMIVCYQMPTDLDTVFALYRQGLIGNTVLSRFNWVFDYRDSTAYFKPNKYFKNPFYEDKSGLIVKAQGIGLNDFVIEGVLPNTAGEKSGIQKGDKILKINKIPVKLLTLQSINRFFQRKSGTKIRLKIKRNGKPLKKVLLLESWTGS